MPPGPPSSYDPEKTTIFFLEESMGLGMLMIYYVTYVVRSQNQRTWFYTSFQDQTVNFYVAFLGSLDF